MVPVREGPRDHEALRDLDLPPLGSARFRFPPVTKSGLLFLTEGRAPGRERSWWEYGSEGSKEELERTFVRAFDKTTGALLWEYELPGPSSAQPMTYLYRGKQYLVVTVGGMGLWKEELVAFALP
jgi:quinoprotein glucose dehydrogenase